MNPAYKFFTDEQIVADLKVGRQLALSEIFDRYWDRLLVVASNLLDSAEDAEDCVQNVFLNIWNRRESIELTHSLHTYLSVAVKYQCLTKMSKRHRERENVLFTDEIVDSKNFFTPENAYILKELKQQIERSINQLPEKCKIVFQMRNDDNMNIKEIASQIGISQNTVKMHLKLANKKIRKDLITLIPLLMLMLFKSN